MISLAGCQTKPAAIPPAAPRQAGLFRDVASEAGLHYRWHIEGPRPLIINQTLGNGCAFLDYDNDGNLDILLIGRTPALYRGDGRGHFTDVTASAGLGKLNASYTGCAVGDYDNDGYPDVYISAAHGGTLLHNERGQGFTDATPASAIPAQPWGTACSWFDYDGDGKLDLFVGNYVQFGPHTMPQYCGNFGVRIGCHPRYYPALKGRLYRNLGGGRFEDVTHKSGLDSSTGKCLGSVAADIDGSGWQSLILANDEVPGDLMLNRRGKFTNRGAASGIALGPAGFPHAGMGLDVGDFDNDGRFDIAVMTFADQDKSIFRNEGHGLFSAPVGGTLTPYVAWGVKWIDYDNDGWLDLMITNGHVFDNIAEWNAALVRGTNGQHGHVDRAGATFLQPTQLLHNIEGKRFSDVSEEGGPALDRPIAGRGLAIGDFDNDGRVDALIVDSEGAPLLLHNETPDAGHWLLCRLIGRTCSRDAYGAVVTVRTANQKHTLVRRCQTDGSYLSASDPRVHFGLGPATKADVAVRWPGGRLERWTGVAANQIFTLRQGTGK